MTEVAGKPTIEDLFDSGEYVEIEDSSFLHQIRGGVRERSIYLRLLDGTTWAIERDQYEDEYNRVDIYQVEQSKATVTIWEMVDEEAK